MNRACPVTEEGPDDENIMICDEQTPFNKPDSAMKEALKSDWKVYHAISDISLIIFRFSFYIKATLLHI